MSNIIQKKFGFQPFEFPIDETPEQHASYTKRYFDLYKKAWLAGIDLDKLGLPKPETPISIMGGGSIPVPSGGGGSIPILVPTQTVDTQSSTVRQLADNVKKLMKAIRKHSRDLLLTKKQRDAKQIKESKESKVELTETKKPEKESKQTETKLPRQYISGLHSSSKEKKTEPPGAVLKNTLIKFLQKISAAKAEGLVFGSESKEELLITQTEINKMFLDVLGSNKNPDDVNFMNTIMDILNDNNIDIRGATSIIGSTKGKKEFDNILGSRRTLIHNRIMKAFSDRVNKSSDYLKNKYAGIFIKIKTENPEEKEDEDDIPIIKREGTPIERIRGLRDSIARTMADNGIDIATANSWSLKIIEGITSLPSKNKKQNEKNVGEFLNNLEKSLKKEFKRLRVDPAKALELIKKSVNDVKRTIKEFPNMDKKTLINTIVNGLKTLPTDEPIEISENKTKPNNLREPDLDFLDADSDIDEFKDMNPDDIKSENDSEDMFSDIDLRSSNVILTDPSMIARFLQDSMSSAGDVIRSSGYGISHNSSGDPDDPDDNSATLTFTTPNRRYSFNRSKFIGALTLLGMTAGSIKIAIDQMKKLDRSDIIITKGKDGKPKIGVKPKPKPKKPSGKAPPSKKPIISIPPRGFDDTEEDDEDADNEDDEDTTIHTEDHEEPIEGLLRAEFIDPAEAKLFTSSKTEQIAEEKRWQNYAKVEPGNGLGGVFRNSLQQHNLRETRKRFTNTTKGNKPNKNAIFNFNSKNDKIKNDKITRSASKKENQPTYNNIYQNEFGHVSFEDAFHNMYQQGKKIIFTPEMVSSIANSAFENARSIYQPDMAADKYNSHPTAIGDYQRPAIYRGLPETKVEAKATAKRKMRRMRQNNIRTSTRL
jgi:hypothetical protein